MRLVKAWSLCTAYEVHGNTVHKSQCLFPSKNNKIKSLKISTAYKISMHISFIINKETYLIPLKNIVLDLGTVVTWRL